MSASSRARRALRRSLVLAAALATGVVALYLPALGHDFVYDDREVILGQPRPTSVGEVFRVFAEPHFIGLPYYRPVTRATLLAQKALHGDAPALFHLGNALLAGAAAAAAFALLRAPGFALPRGAAAFAAALFAVHPVTSSVVHPIASGRETLLPGLVMLAAAATWLRGRRLAAHALLALALGSKEQAAALPLLFLWADLCGLARGAPPRSPSAWRAWLRRYAGVAAVALAYAAVRQHLFAGGEWRLAIRDDPIAPLLSLLYAAQVGLAPFAALVYEPEVAAWWSLPRLGAAALLLAAAAGIAWRTHAPPARVAFFWAGWFVLAQLPTANLLRQEARFDERYAWLALLALPAVAAGLAAPYWPRPRARRAIAAAATALLAVLAALNLGRAPAFRDDAHFAAAWLRSDPDAPEAHHLLGVLAAERGRPDEALAHYRAALRRAPDSPDLHVNLAAALAAQGRDAEALSALEEALRLAPDHPEAHLNAGVLLARAGRLDAAIAHWREAVRSDPWRADARARLGAALAARGERAEAEAELRRALHLDPADAEARRALALIEAGGPE